MERAYKLRQDVDRCDDLESEEKAMVNLAAQEYDALKILSAIPEHTDLYKFKMEQYKQVSFQETFIKVCVSGIWRCPGTSEPSRAHLMVSSCLCSSGNNKQC